MATQTGGFGTRIFFLPNPGTDVHASQILKGSGYATINVKGAHYSSQGNLWQKIFGGTDKVTLSTQVDHVAAVKTTSASIEELRKINVGHPYYFDSGRSIALKLPTDGDQIAMGITISAVKNDNLSGALNILNSGELQTTLKLAPPAVSSAVAIAGVVKKLLTNTDPQSTLQGHYDGKLSVAASSDPLRDFCLAQGTLILIYRETQEDTALDGMDSSKLSTDGDGLKYNGQPVQNTYVMFQISYDELRGEDSTSSWSSMFADGEASLLAVETAATDADKQKLWAAAFTAYMLAVKLLNADAEFTKHEKQFISATHLSSLKKAYTDNGGHFGASEMKALFASQLPALTLDNVDDLAKTYHDKLARGQFALPGGTTPSTD